MASCSKQMVLIKLTKGTSVTGTPTVLKVTQAGSGHLTEEIEWVDTDEVTDAAVLLTVT